MIDLITLLNLLSVDFNKSDHSIAVVLISTDPITNREVSKLNVTTVTNAGEVMNLVQLWVTILPLIQDLRITSCSLTTLCLTILLMMMHQLFPLFQETGLKVDIPKNRFKRDLDDV